MQVILREIRSDECTISIYEFHYSRVKNSNRKWLTSYIHLPISRVCCEIFSGLFLCIGVIDKTAEFVAKVGEDFEKKVAAQQAGQAKFAFLNPANPYRKYYELRIQELREGRDEARPLMPKALLDLKQRDEEKRKKREERKMLADGLVKEYPPPPPSVFTLDHPFIAPVDMDIIMITAQFVARNGNKFLHGLMSRESRNPQFDFIKPEHHLYGYFQSLIDSYTKVLLLPPEEKEKLEQFVAERQNIIDRINNRYLYLAQEAKRRADKEKQEGEMKEGFGRIDWSNFVIIGKLDFPQDESIKLAVPIDPRTGKYYVTGAPVPLGGDVFTMSDGAVEEPEAFEEEIEMEPVGEPKQQVQEEEELPTATAVPIRTDYVRAPKGSLRSENYLKSPITGEMIRESEFSDHMRIVLLDPQWKRQSDIVMKRAREEASALAEDIGDNISDFIKKRMHLWGDSGERSREVPHSPPEKNEPKVIGPSLPPKRQKQ